MNLTITAWIASVMSLATAGPIYKITDLGSLGGASAASYGLSPSGLVVGAASTPFGYMHAFLATNAGMTDLTIGTGATEGAGSGVNGTGQIAGTQYTGGQAYATLWTNGVPQAIGGAGSYAMAIGDAGQVTGMFTTPGGQGHAFLDANGVLQDLGTLPGGTWSSGYAVNGANQVAGYGDVGGGSFRAYIWSPGSGYLLLGTLGGTSSYALAINDSGQAAGTAQLSSGYVHAFVSNGATLEDLGTLGGASSYAYGIDSQGDVIGYSWLSGAGDPHAFLYVNGVMIDLNGAIGNSTGWVLTQAYAINNAGQIVGAGLFNGTEHAFLLDAQPQNDPISSIPEPRTWTAVAGGLVAGALKSRTKLPRLNLRRSFRFVGAGTTRLQRRGN